MSTVPYIFANESGVLPLSQLDANFANVKAQVDNANTVTGNAQANITSVGTLTSLSVSGNVTGSYFLGNGSQLTGLPSGYGNANVAANLAAFANNPILTTGNVGAGNVNVTTATGNLVFGKASATGSPGINSTSSFTIVADRFGTPKEWVFSTDGSFAGSGNIGANNITVSNLLNVLYNGSAGLTIDVINPAATLTAAAGKNLIIGADDGNAYIGIGVDGTFGGPGTIDMTGNVSGGNLKTTGIVSATGNITSTGNISGGNLTTTGNLVFSPTQVQSSAYAGGNGHMMMIDTNRTDTYVEIGTADKPFKTFAAAIAAVAAANPSGTVPYTFVLMGCSINEDVDFTPYNFNFITISTTCRSTFNNPVTFGNSALLQLTVRNVEFGDTMTITGDGTTNQLNNTSFYNVSFGGAVTVTAANSLAFYEAAFFSTVTFNNVNYLYVNGGQFNDDWTIRADNTGAYAIPSNGITPGVSVLLDFIANDINFVKGGTGTYVFQPQGSRMGRTTEAYTLPAGWTLSAYSSVFRGTWTNNGTWAMRNSSNDNPIAGTAPTYSGTIGGSIASVSGNISGANINTTGVMRMTHAVGSQGEMQFSDGVGSSFIVEVGTSAGTWAGAGSLNLITSSSPGGNIGVFVAQNESARFTATGANVTGTLGVTGNITGGNIITAGNITGNTAGYAIGFRDIPQVSFAGNTTIATTDAGKHYYSVLSTGNVLTIANNASQGFQVGSTITVVNQGTGTITVEQGSGVTLYLAGNASSGNRSVATFGMATIMKVDTDTWFINGTGVS